MPQHRNFPDMIEIGAPFSNVVVDGDYAFLSGLVAADTKEGQAVLGDVAAETEVVMRTIRALLTGVRLQMEDIVRCDVHLTDLADMHAMNEVYGRFFEEGAYPARTTTQSGALFGGSKVEITCVARMRAG